MNLKQVRKLCEDAAVGPWKVGVRTDEPDYCYVSTPGGMYMDVGYAPNTARFIAASRTLMPLLLEVVEIADRLQLAEAEGNGEMPAAHVWDLTYQMTLLNNILQEMEE